jgi:hypothetical protein
MNTKLALPTILSCPEKQQVGVGIFYNFVSFYAIPFFAIFLIADLPDPHFVSWFEAGFHIINAVVCVGLFREFLWDGVTMFSLQAKEHFAVLWRAILACCLVGAVLFLNPIAKFLFPYALPVTEGQIFFFGADMLYYNPLMGFLGALVLSPVATACMFYAIGFAPAFNKKPWLGYVVVIALLAFFHIGNDSTGFDFVTEIMAFAAQLPFHLIACWAFRRSDNICVPIITLASVNLLSSVVLFIMTLFV